MTGCRHDADTGPTRNLALLGFCKILHRAEITRTEQALERCYEAFEQGKLSRLVTPTVCAASSKASR